MQNQNCNQKLLEFVMQTVCTQSMVSGLLVLLMLPALRIGSIVAISFQKSGVSCQHSAAGVLLQCVNVFKPLPGIKHYKALRADWHSQGITQYPHNNFDMKTQSKQNSTQSDQHGKVCSTACTGPCPPSTQNTALSAAAPGVCGVCSCTLTPLCGSSNSKHQSTTNCTSCSGSWVLHQVDQERAKTCPSRVGS
jgi:hypothetical protein